MKKILFARYFICLIICLIFISGENFAQRAKKGEEQPINLLVVYGNIVYKKGNTPVKGARIDMVNTKRNTSSDVCGDFEFEYNPKDRVIKVVTPDGYSDTTSYLPSSKYWTMEMATYTVQFNIIQRNTMVDTDWDAVPDYKDKCKNTPGKKEFCGCPDTDGDGIIDSEDKCPIEAGTRENQGCPDRDGDGIIDNEDKCPKEVGTRENQGCPDSDGDGIIDSEDKCPKEVGTRENKGCPDTDGDGIIDSEDKCINEKGPASNFGCPVVDLQTKWTGNVSDTLFIENFDKGPMMSVKKVLSPNLIDKHIIPNDGMISLIEKLNPELKLQLLTQSKISVIMPNFPQISEEKALAIEEEFNQGESIDSLGTNSFIAECKKFNKIYKRFESEIKDSVLLVKLKKIDFTLSVSVNNPDLKLRKYEADLLNMETVDFRDYFLELAVDYFKKPDIEYIEEYGHTVNSILQPGSINEPDTSNNSGFRGPSSPYFTISENNYPQPDDNNISPVKVLFYVCPPGPENENDSFNIYILSRRQFTRIREGGLTFAELDLEPGARCNNPATPTAKAMLFTYMKYIVAVKKDNPEKIYAISITGPDNIPKLELLREEQRKKINSPFALVLYKEN